MKLGLIARMDNSGLGVQTHEFYKHMQPDKTMVVDISKYNGNKQYPERYPDGIFIKGFPTPADIDSFLEGLDVIFVAESPYNFYLYERARELGVKIAVQYNYEFFDWFANPHYPKPDLLIAPSKWHYNGVEGWCQDHNIKHTYLHNPVNRELLPRKEIKQARVFLHNAGRSASFDRNGTETVIDASKYIKTDAQIVIHFQGEQGLAHQTTSTIADYADRLEKQGDPNKVTLEQIEFKDYADVYSQGDVLLLPRRYGGNCLPLNEALSVGMPVIMTDISPNNEFLPTEWLLPAHRINQFTPRTTIDIYGSHPEHLADRIDQMYELPEDEFRQHTDTADRIAETISWGALKPKYQKVLEDICQKK